MSAKQNQGVAFMPFDIPRRLHAALALDGALHATPESVPRRANEIFGSAVVQNPNIHVHFQPFLPEKAYRY
jgi:hypothetical protein